MTTVLVSGGGTCSASCYDARGSDCSCEACGGVLHGVGRERAVEIAPILVAGGRAAVAVLELPLTSALDGQPAAGAPAAAAGPACVKCGRSAAESPGQIAYLTGPICRACRRAALELHEEVG